MKILIKLQTKNENFEHNQNNLLIKQKLNKKNNNITDGELNNIKFNGKKRKLYELIKSKLIKVSGRTYFPGFYPLGDKVKIDDVISLSGGYLSDADQENLEIISFDRENLQKKFIYPGDTVFIPQKYSQKSNINLLGSVEQPRSIGYRKGLMLSEIINTINLLKEDTYLYFAHINRTLNKDKNKIIIPFSPLSILQGKQDFELSKGDKINIYSTEQIKNILKSFENDVNIITPKLNIEKSEGEFFSGSPLELVKSLSIQINGAIINEGFLILGDSYSLNQIIKISGGVKTLADVSNILVTEPIIDDSGGIKLSKNIINLEKNENKIIKPGSSIRIPFFNNELDLGKVSIFGEVRQPGTYVIKSDSTMFDILKESGGLNKNAYLEGLVFTRLEEQKREKASIDRLRREIDKSLASALKSDGESQNLMTKDTISALREISLSSIDFKPIGRVVGNYADIALLKILLLLKEI